jgi:hypothetical protein
VNLVDNFKLGKIADAIAGALAKARLLGAQTFRWVHEGFLALVGLLTYWLEAWATGGPVPWAAGERDLAPHGAYWNGGGVGDCGVPPKCGGIEEDLLAANATPAEGGIADEVERMRLKACFRQLGGCRAQTVRVASTVPGLLSPRHFDVGSSSPGRPRGCSRQSRALVSELRYASVAENSPCRAWACTRVAASCYAARILWWGGAKLSPMQKSLDRRIFLLALLTMTGAAPG